MAKRKISIVDTVNKDFEAIRFAQWLHNNWYEPIGYDGMWRVRIEDEEYLLEEPKINIFTPAELFVKFRNGEGEL